jgi:DNA modification methylase
MQNEIILCNCIDGMAQLAADSIPLSITSPPYDGLRTYDGHVAAFDFESIAWQLYRVTVPGGVACWVVGEQIVHGCYSGSTSEHRLFFRDLGFRLHDWLFIQTDGGGRQARGKVGYAQAIQQVFVLSKGRPNYINVLRDRKNSTAGEVIKRSYRNPDGTLRIATLSDQIVPQYGPRRNLWQIGVGYNRTTADEWVYCDAPALMPEQLANDLILSYSRPGWLVFDPMAGAGTVPKMAVLNNRHFLGMEICPKYHALAVRRVNEALELRHKRRASGLFQENMELWNKQQGKPGKTKKRETEAVVWEDI